MMLEVLVVFELALSDESNIWPGRYAQRSKFEQALRIEAPGAGRRSCHLIDEVHLGSLFSPNSTTVYLCEVPLCSGLKASSFSLDSRRSDE